MDEPEERLVERAKEDPEAFGALYERYVDQIYQYIFYRTGNRYDAEDLTAKTFYRALSNLDRYRYRGLPFSAWLYRIAHNLVANWHRDRQRRRTIPLDSLAMAAKSRGSAEELVEAGERAAALREAIARLAPDRQELLVLKYTTDLSNREIGKVMGRTEGAIKALYHRTLVSLRKDLQNRGL
ncbi:MAG: sigma-70 family RNA polymerase sigma factor [Anaerolineae bacterium]|nr:sigma-70 family RNA polymerase sigma factor [Anaerolineae bacterium]NIN98640.1 sigma-70 family RNA polymerase sigma factor [Anaerolineae bacterium]NIQ81527.1 sigma-70 family RNA polymerase sigma factor [Anaerolineae bacterium]